MATDPTLYEYYTSDGISKGLSIAQPNFTLNNKPITIFSGAIHYFRVPPPYWRDRLLKMRAAGLNCIETYVPWNLHEPEPGSFDFGQGSNDFSDFLDIIKFLEIAQELDLFVIVRPGPYICAEWEFGGLPSWLLRDDIKIRTSDKKYIDYVKSYFDILLSKLVQKQFVKGGPIIAFQIENEYGNTKNDNDPIDIKYLETLKEIFLTKGIVELLFTSDTPSNGFWGTLPGILATANFQDRPIEELTLLKEFQPGKPLMVMEYWTGWFDHWAEKHHTRTATEFGKVLEEILNFNSSVNMYMFHGGTNWGLLNGANIKDFSSDNATYQPDTTSYDYDAPLSEAGDYTDKYFKVQELIGKYNTIKTKIPLMPELQKRVAFDKLIIDEQLSLQELIKQIKYVEQASNVKSMEYLNLNNKAGQCYGYIIYRKTNINISSNSILKIEGRVCDSIMVLIDGKLKSKVLKGQSDLDDFGYWRLKDSTLNLGSEEYISATLELIVENWGRVNYGKLNQFNQYKGLWQGNVLLNDEIMEDFDIIPLEFKKSWNEGLCNWQKVDLIEGPALYKTVLNIEEPCDTYIDLRKWCKGIVIVNGFVLSRYLKLGPQQTAFLPGAFLKKGNNVILIFEHFISHSTLEFVTDPIFCTL